MPVPTTFADLSTTIASNSPAGSDNVFPDLDNYIRALAGMLASVSANSGNGWTSPYLALLGGTVSGATTFSGAVTLSGSVSGAALTNYLAAPAAIGGTTPAAGAFTTLSASGAVTLSGGTANGVLYLNGSKVATSGSALTFDGTNFATTGTASATKLIPTGGSATGNGMYLPAANTLAWSNNGAETMRLDSSGNLGLGVTPSAWGLGKAFEVGALGNAVWGGAGYVDLMQNVAYTSGAYRYSTTAAAARYEMQTGTHVWFTAPSGTAGNTISFTQAMTLDASGNLVVGATSASARLDVVGGTGIRVNEDGASTKVIQVRSDFAGVGPAINVATNDPLLLQTNNTERARITSGGDFGIGNTNPLYRLTVDKDTTSALAFFTNSNASAPNGLYVDFSASSPNNATQYFLYCEDSTAQRATIRSNGGIANYQANDVNLSDRREKTDFAPAKDYLDTICAIPVQTFNYIDQSPDDPGLTLGVVAQDVQAVAPELVMESNWGTEDNPKMRLSVYQTDLQYALMKAIQELKAQNDDLRARVAQLERH